MPDAALGECGDEDLLRRRGRGRGRVMGEIWGRYREMQDLLSDEARADGLCQPSGEASGVVLGGAERADHLDAAEGAAQLAAPAGHLHLLSEVKPGKHRARARGRARA